MKIFWSIGHVNIDESLPLPNDLTMRLKTCIANHENGETPKLESPSSYNRRRPLEQRKPIIERQQITHKLMRCHKLRIACTCAHAVFASDERCPLLLPYDDAMKRRRCTVDVSNAAAASACIISAAAAAARSAQSASSPRPPNADLFHVALVNSRRTANQDEMCSVGLCIFYFK